MNKIINLDFFTCHQCKTPIWLKIVLWPLQLLLSMTTLNGKLCHYWTSLAELPLSWFGSTCQMKTSRGANQRLQKTRNRKSSKNWKTYNFQIHQNVTEKFSISRTLLWGSIEPLWKFPESDAPINPTKKENNVSVLRNILTPPTLVLNWSIMI